MNLDGFPRRTLRGDLELHRIHKAANDPWWFSTDGSGRFDTKHGTCYFAGRPIGAWVEVFRKRMLLPEEEVTGRALHTVALGRSLRLADITSRRALAFGVTASLGADESYAAGQRFAAAAIDAGLRRHPLLGPPRSGPEALRLRAVRTGRRALAARLGPADSGRPDRGSDPELRLSRPPDALISFQVHITLISEH